MQGSITIAREKLKELFRKDGTTWGGPKPKDPETTPPLDDATKAFCDYLVATLKGGMDVIYAGKGRDFARFYVLETVARVPYFAYMSVLHLYESLGMHGRASWIKVHFAEADNELHHLLIMESLGGSDRFEDRFFAKNSALLYYWANVIFYMVHPRGAYYMMSLIEDHAHDTYGKFLESNEEKLKTLPVPQIAKKYYEAEDMYLFDAFHTSARAKPASPRRPRLESLYDVFCCIRDDEHQHRSTLHCLVETGKPAGNAIPVRQGSSRKAQEGGVPPVKAEEPGV